MFNNRPAAQRDSQMSTTRSNQLTRANHTSNSSRNDFNTPTPFSFTRNGSQMVTNGFGWPNPTSLPINSNVRAFRSIGPQQTTVSPQFPNTLPVMTLPVQDSTDAAEINSNPASTQYGLCNVTRPSSRTPNGFNGFGFRMLQDYGTNPQRNVVNEDTMALGDGGAGSMRSGVMQSDRDELETLNFNPDEWTTMFDLPVAPTTLKAATVKGKHRKNPYGPGEVDAKRKALNRATKHLKELLDYILLVHPEVDFFVYLKATERTNLLKVSESLRGIDKTRYMNNIYSSLEEYASNEQRPSKNGISIRDRFLLTGQPTPTDTQTAHELAFDHFKETQSVKSLRPIYSKWTKKGFVVRKVVHNPSREWLLENMKPLFCETSSITTRDLFDALYPLTFHEAPGEGLKHSEVTKKHICGVLQSLDLLAIARNEQQIPQDIDFAGNSFIVSVYHVLYRKSIERTPWRFQVQLFLMMILCLKKLLALQKRRIM